MLDAEIPEFPVQGETGIDLFQRLEDPSQRRARFRCTATVRDGTVIDHQPERRRPAARLRALADSLPRALPPLSLTDSRTWADLTLAARDPLALFLYLEFFRAWQVAEIAARRFEAQLDRAPDTVPAAPGALTGAIAPLYDLNRTGRGMALTRRLLPLLSRVVSAPGFRDVGVAPALLDAVAGWARTIGADRLRMWVVERNEFAKAFYLNEGFEPTGATIPYELDPRINQVAMVRRV